ncbi:MAG TPA: hypothetical protein VNL94_01360, partial [Candidatus Binatia bacterium]|nr:hypothetical protein [Candidatus Binatia bacterium]
MVQHAGDRSTGPSPDRVGAWLPRTLGRPRSGRLLPLFVAATELGRTPRGGSAIPGASAVLLGAAIPFADAPPDGWESLLWYPRVDGALLLWSLLVVLALRRR